MSLPNWVSYDRRKAFSALGNQAKAEKRLTLGVDADTLRRRALYDARGQIIRHGATYRSTGVTHWQVRRSTTGRIDQFDFVANDRVKLIAGSRRFPQCFRP
jgi:hypothetical protein